MADGDSKGIVRTGLSSSGVMSTIDSPWDTSYVRILVVEKL